MSRQPSSRLRPPSDWPEDHADDISGSEDIDEEAPFKADTSLDYADYYNTIKNSLGRSESQSEDSLDPGVAHELNYTGQRRSSGYSQYDNNYRNTQYSFNNPHPDGQAVDIYSSLKNTRLSDSRYAAYAPSTDSLLAMIESKKPNFPSQNISSYSRVSSWALDENVEDEYQDLPNKRSFTKDYPWPAWVLDNQVPISKEEIWSIFEDLAARFGFQSSSIHNQFDALMTMLDSRSSRMSAAMALLTLHADYIGGVNANYRTWFFAVQAHRDIHLGVNQVEMDPTEEQVMSDSLEEWWRLKMSKLSPTERVQQIALYLCIWGEALNLRYLPEMICFIYKLAYDHLLATQHQIVQVSEGDYLDRIVTPVYDYIRDQNYEVINGQFLKRELDHAQVIGYDDINETFWSKENMERLVLSDKSTLLMSVPPSERYTKLGEVNWKMSILKTYYERRSWLHMVTNFSRVWIFHFSAFFMFWIVNSQFFFTPLAKYKTARQAGLDSKDIEDKFYPIVFSLVGAGGAVAAWVALSGTFFEFFFVEKCRHKYRILFRRYFILLGLLIINLAPTVCIFLLGQKENKKAAKKSIKRRATVSTPRYILSTGIEFKTEPIWYTVGIIHMIMGIFTTIFLIITPPADLFIKFPKLSLKTSSLPGLINRSFTANYADLNFKDRTTSVIMWTLILLCKSVESYMGLIWSFKSAMRILVYLEMRNLADSILAERSYYILVSHRYLSMSFLVLLLFIMFFLDTYLWYIVMTSLFSVANAFQMGISVLSPWKNIFGLMPKRIYTKVLATRNKEIKLRPKILCSQIWNAIVISMYRDHLLSIDHVQKLLYQQVDGEYEGKKKIKPPAFFVAQEDTGLNEEFYPPGSEAERRISFFASSLSTVMPVPLPVENMPTFTVFTPHYSEKILLSLREIIREDDQYTRVTLLEYLKSLYAIEWEHFVKDTKILAEENALMDELPTIPSLDEEKTEAKIREEDLPFYCIGFKSASPEFTLRTRIWASLRTQTLYRTITGFMNYSKALKFLHRIENPELVTVLSGNVEALETELDLMSRRKFNFLISMQRYTKFNKEEKDNVEFLFTNYPDLQVAYLEDIPSDVEGIPPTMYSCLIDGHCELDEDGKRIPRYRIRIPGNPILGDGKSDNQNHAVIFTRGEYLQVIDANQDNYLEEALKIRSVLAEFEEYQPPAHSPYAPPSKLEEIPKPVAILGAREYIFSENIGILGDIAAGKESTFGTLTHRILSKVGGRLHYGHPDFLNMIFMNTRGGLSKAQKGLHLNEDIFAGMNAFQRGGRVKHSEYVQCGKGRDLGFCSVLNFTTKIGTGMGEQLLSREYYYLYTQLPLDRMLTLFYAHPGFHVNNMLIMLSIQVFMIALVLVGVLVSTQNVCDPAIIKDELPSQYTCITFSGILNWIDRTVASVFIVLSITFIPLAFQVLSEQGFVRTVTRIGKQLASCAPMLEIFTTQIYSNSIMNNMSFGGARYIGTGRGFATTRQPFSTLYSRFSSSSIHAGMRNGLMLMFVCLAPFMFRPAFLYFWFTVFGLTLSPWVFNPHQFSLIEFILDYRAFIRWMSRGNSAPSKDSWISHCRYTRTRITGQKRKRLGDREHKLGGHIPRAHRLTIFTSELVFPFFMALIMVIAYTTLSIYDPLKIFAEYKTLKQSLYYGTEMFVGYKSTVGSSGIFKSLIVGVVPVGINMGILLVFFFISLVLGPLFSVCAKSFGSYIAGIARGISVVGLIGCVLLLFLLENFDLSRMLMGVIAGAFIQKFLFSLLMFLFLTREFGHDGVNCAWWTGKWVSAGLGYMTITQPFREFICKTIELSLFSTDFLIAHIIFICLAPFTLIPRIDKVHSTMLFWLSPGRQINPPIFSLRQKTIRRRRAIKYGILFVTFSLIFLALFIVPPFLRATLLDIVGKDLIKKLRGFHL